MFAPPSGSSGPSVAAAGVPSSASLLPADLATNPVLARWLDFSQDGEVRIRTGKVEYGQGIWTALAQVAAEELQVALARVRVAPVSTSTSPDEGVTAGSLSVQDSGSRCGRRAHRPVTCCWPPRQPGSGSPMRHWRWPTGRSWPTVPPG
jgi:Molybdopterin-binding domain of aldehyde dehydrogenase